MIWATFHRIKTNAFHRIVFCRYRRNHLWSGVNNWIFGQSVDVDEEEKEDEEGAENKRKMTKTNMTIKKTNNLGQMIWRRLGMILKQKGKMPWIRHGLRNMVNRTENGLVTWEKKRKLGIDMRIMIVRYRCTVWNKGKKSRRLKVRRKRKRIERKKGKEREGCREVRTEKETWESSYWCTC